MNKNFRIIRVIKGLDKTRSFLVEKQFIYRNFGFMDAFVEFDGKMEGCIV